MPQGKNQHVILRHGRWLVKAEGGRRASSVHATQEGAIQAGCEKASAEKSELRIHGSDGRIQERRSFAEDSSLNERQP